MNAIVKALKKALEVDPSNWETRQALVEAHLNDGDTAEAFAALDSADIATADEAALIAATRQLAQAGGADSARALLQKVLGRNPASADAHVALAQIAHAAGDSQTATRHYVSATSLNPTLSDPDLEAAYGAVLDSIGLRKAATPEPVAVTPDAADVEEEEEDAVAVVQAVAAADDDDEAGVVLAVADAEEAAPVAAAEEVVAPVTAAARPLTPPAPKVVEETPAPAVAAETNGAATVPLIKRPTSSRAAVLAEPDDVPAITAKPAAPPVPTLVAAEVEAAAEVYEPDPLAEELRHLREEVEEKRKRAMARDKMASLTVTILIHVGAFFILTLMVTSVVRDVPPGIIATSAPADSVEEITQTTLNKTQIKPNSAAAAPSSEVITSQGLSSVAISNIPSDNVGISASLGMDFAPSMSFGDATQSMQSKMMFGQKLEGVGEVLGVILDVSGSMAEYLPLVIKEVDRNFKNAPIVYVNHAGMEGGTKDCEIYPIIPDEVRPSWPKEWNKGIHSPYWFMWGDLPRKADQKQVDRLIDIFKTRPNMFIARGGRNRVGAAAEFLSSQKCDSLYIFSDFEDFVEEEIVTELGQKLGRSKVKTFVQPAAARTEHLAVVSRRVAGRTGGRELPVLTEILRPQAPQAEIAVAVKQELPVPDGVKFATPRNVRPVDPALGYNHNRWWDDDHRKRFDQELKVVEYPNFDIVVNGPEARALIYLKTKDGFVQSPIIFGYWSHKPYQEPDGRWYYPRRKWLRNAEEPKFDGNEFTWKMILEDEITFDVIFWFKEDMLTGTYTAQLPPNGESDAACIFFAVPPVGLERNDMYYSPDFPQGLDLDQLRQVMAHNFATFYLPVQAEERHGVAWSRLGFKKGENTCPYNVLYRYLPDAVREVTIGGRSFGERRLQARTTSNNLLLSTALWRADIELWEGFQCRLIRERDERKRERVVKTEAISFSIE